MISYTVESLNKGHVRASHFGEVSALQRFKIYSCFLLSEGTFHFMLLSCCCLVQGNKAAKDGQFEEAIESYTQAIDLYSNDERLLIIIMLINYNCV